MNERGLISLANDLLLKVAAHCDLSLAPVITLDVDLREEVDVHGRVRANPFEHLFQKTITTIHQKLPAIRA